MLGLARVAVQRGDYAEAVRRFTEYLKASPNDVAVRRELAGVLVRAGDRRRAIEEYRRILTDRPGDLAATLALADVYIATREYREAAGLLGQALQRQPDNAALMVRLARVLTFQRDFLHAQQLADRVRAAHPPDDERVPRDLATLLLDLQQPAEALLYLLKQNERRPKDFAVGRDLVRAYAGLGDTGQALKAAEDFARAEGGDLAERLGLADTLLDAGHDLVAATVYGQVLGADAANVAAQIGLARVAIYQHHPLEALKHLECLKPADAQRRAYQLAWAEYHQLIGEYTEALRIYRDIIQCDPLDGEALLARAKLLQFVHEYEKARAEYSKIPADSSYARQARLGCASTLYDQRRFAESMELCEKLLAEMPADGDAAALMIRNLAKSGDGARAVTFGRGFLAAFARIEPVALPVQLALGRALLDAGLFAEAAREFECLLNRPTGRVPTAWYGLSRARAKLADPASAEAPLLAAFADPGHETRNRLLLADLFYADNDDGHVVELVRCVLKHDSKNLAALIRLADSLLRLARPTAFIGDVVRVCKDILGISPTNVRAHLALARAHATAADYPAAVHQYDELIIRDPAFLVPQREKARVLFSAHEYAASAAAYEAMLHPGPDQLLAVGVQGFLLHCTPAQGVLGPMLCSASGPALAIQVAREADTIADPGARACLRALLLDTDARAAEIAVIQLEAAGKSKKDWRNFTAVPIYNELTHKEPDNIEAFFDLGQVYGELKQTHHAQEQFAQILAIDPLHREAGIALERSGLELNPRLGFNVNYFNQNGRDNTATIARTTFGPTLTCPYGEEDETVTIGYTRTRYNPPGFAPLNGNWLTFGGSKRLDETTLIHGVTNIEQYTNRVSTRPTFDAGVSWFACDGCRLNAGGFLNNVLENGESLQQDIFRGGLNLGADAMLSRRWHAVGNYRFAYYSDVNRLNELYFSTDYAVTMAPCQLKAIFDFNYLSYSEQTVFGNNIPGNIVGAIHPYFAPSSFAYYQGRLAWTQWLSRDYFVYSNQCWYSLQAGLGFDNSLFTYTDLRAILNWDVKPWLSVGLQGEALWSSVYKMQQAYGYVAFRFPQRIW